ncbi:DNA polymerase III subunit beta [Psychroflexus salis]|uniref:Beta sliding clamp n=1 Tax=Psychroflexus salis TaxID=1526574 RepID=A0A916ZPL7_9FLAO|nr:DNA polymerase III subunit beta [Psychroflexus salis]GGE06511.1 DNA polymerase III subunit beta [Psychroflexus salis]
MKFIVSSTEMLKKLQTLGGIINNNNTMQILDFFLFKLDNNQLDISASDLETTMSAVINVESENQGEIAVPAKLLLDTLKTFPEQPLTFLVLENSVVEISSDQGKYSLAYANAEDFPNPIELQDASKTVITADVLATAINKTLFATGNDDLRPVMNGIFFQFTAEGLKFVGTDAHKLVKYSRDDIKIDDAADFIMPKKPLNLLKNTLSGDESDVLIEYNDSNAKFTFNDFVLTCRLIDGKYPNYEAVIPKENPNKLIIDRQQFLNSVKRVSIFSNKTTHQIRMKIAGAELKISAEDIDYSSKAEERLTCDYQGDDMEIGFNSRFLLEMLANLNASTVQLEMSLPNRAGILTPVDGLEEGEQVTMLVMPVMLGNS